MTKKSRYLLLLTGFTFFLILAPIIVLYVRGISYDSSSGSFVTTGILAVRSEPSRANIYLNGKLKQTKDGDINFLLPGEYQLELKKDGYYDWQKRLAIEESKVTWTSSKNNKIYLLKKSSATQDIAKDVVDFYLKDEYLTYLTTENIIVGSVNEKGQIYKLPKLVNKISVSGNDQYLILSDNSSTSSKPTILIFNTDTGIFNDISSLAATLEKPMVISDNVLYYLNGAELNSYDINSKIAKPLLENVRSFFIQNSSLYYIQEKNKVNSLFISQYPYTQSQLLIDSLPQFTKGELFVTFSKQIILLADNALYKANTVMEKIAGEVQDVYFDPLNTNILLLHLGQFDYYDTNSQGLNFVTRSTENLKNLNVKNNIGYAFYSNSSGLNAIELDRRDKQNQYQLYSSNALKKFSIYNSDQSILLLDNTELKSITIR